MRFLRAATLFLLVAGICLSGPIAQAWTENWAADPASGCRVCIMFWDDSEKLLTAAWAGPAAGGLADGAGRLQFVYRDKAGREQKAEADGEMKAGKLSGRVSIKWSDGDSFEGLYSEGLRNGPGVFRFANGTVYDGEYKNSVIDGRGVMKWPDGSVYEGSWKNGSMDGQGRLKFADGTVYEGDFRRGKRDGRGSQRWPDGTTFDGDWKSDRREGKGLERRPNGLSYEGDWKNDVPEGYGTTRQKNGDIYQGEWKNGSLNGRGTYQAADGETYEGEWKDGKRDGKGIARLRGGEVYDGEFKDNKREGQGVFRWTNGAVYQGEFKNDVRDGQGVMTDAAGKMIFSGQWQSDKPVTGPGPAEQPPAAGQVKADKVLGIAWEASEDEAKRIMKQRPGTEYWFTKKDDRQSWQSYIGPFNNDRAGIYVYFYQGKMFQVVIAHLLADDKLLGKFNELKAGMSQRYGAPAEESGKYLDSVAKWDLGGGYRAGLRIQRSGRADLPFEVQLSYWHRPTYLLVHPEAGQATAGKDF